ncbi:hypothetical protein KC19_7G024700 [Ceratodon purpureus]|uniref:DUF924-domain-containing protein n=1 Tax=Ceratodon purpureus TaxID=3225 RepID=A0A8T0H596_CERPU|nr:hypothetical protein KC19_N042300 [Ceratodon purpureus]KAG0565935.1 hypothetical protein KC19_7G024700 [Ceratodon purpureus]
MMPCGQGAMMARGLLSGAPLVSSSRLLRSLLWVQSLRECVDGNGFHEPVPPTCSRRFYNGFSCESTSLALQPVWQSISCSRVRDRCGCGRAWRAVGVSGFGTDAAPASNVAPEDVLHFWFKDADVAKNQFPMQFWFMGGEEADKEIKGKFGDCLELAIQGKLDHWKSTPRGRVALVLVLDQFSRNCYRDSSRAFAQDEAALKITLDSVEQGLDLQLSNPLERYFLYMPLMHSENPQVHVEAQRLFQKLADEHKDSPELHKMLQYVVKFEKAHSTILNKYGRYPSRNALLGRKSTPQEEEYLASGVTWPMED